MINGSPRQFIGHLEWLDLEMMATNLEAKRLGIPAIERLKLLWAGRLVRKVLTSLTNPNLNKRLVICRDGGIVTLNRKV